MFEGRNIFTTLCVVTLLIILVPLFVDQQRIRNISQSGSLDDTLRTSVAFKVLEGVTIGSALPMLVDIALDKSFNVSNMDIARLSLPQFVSVLSSIIYLSTFEQYYVTYLYTCCFTMRVLVSTAVFFHFLSKGKIATTGNIPLWNFLLPPILLSLSKIFLLYSILFPEYNIISILAYITGILNAASIVLLQGHWFLCLWREKRVRSYFTNEDTEEISYMLGYLLCFLGVLGLNIASTKWLNTTLSVLIGYHILQISLVVWLTVMPGRLLRKIAEVDNF